MKTNSSTIPATIGRLLLALYFLLPGLMKFTQFENHIALMEHHNIKMAAPLLMIAGVASILGAFLLIINRHVRFTAFGFVLYILLVNILLHDFWNFEGAEAQHELQNFIKNLGIMAGTLILAGTSVKRSLQLADLFKSDKACASKS